MDDFVSPVDPGHDDLDSDSSSGRSRTFMVLLYPDNEDHERWIKDVLPKLDFDYVGICHDKEESAKPHYHIVFYFKDARWRDAFAADLGLDTRWVRAWNSKVRAFRYLLHKGFPDKVQYSDTGLFGGLTDACISACGRASPADESKQAKQIFELLASIDGTVTIESFAIIALENHLWSAFRRMGNIAIRAIDSHNSSFMVSYNRKTDNDRLQMSLASSMLSENGLSFAERCELLDRLGFPAKDLPPYEGDKQLGIDAFESSLSKSDS